MKLLTLEEFNQLTPQAQGYAVYMQAAWPDSPLKDENPYPAGTPEHLQFNNGSFAAMIDAQDDDD